MDKQQFDLPLSLETNIFIQDNFNVDKFLQEQCSKFGLHKLHKELGNSIKYLHVLMMDLVNGECSMIVNLSCDLKVLQYRFDSIRIPLGQFREEVLQIYKIINEILSRMKYILEQKQLMTSLKSTKIYELRITISSQKVSRILSSHMKDSKLNMEILERSVDQYILQEMYYQNCNIKLQINQSITVLNQILNNMFLQAILQHNTDHIIRCLKMYMLMNSQTTAELLYANQIVRPILGKIINENVLQKANGNLNLIYAKIIKYVKEDLRYFLSVVHKSQDLSGFHFVLNSIWSEINDQLRFNVASIYAAGNPTTFQNRFMQTRQFFLQFETCFMNENELMLFRLHDSLVSHKQLWNLVVYYEIRHLEIVKFLEEKLPDVISDGIFTKNGCEFKLLSSANIWNSMTRCFDPDVYISELLDKFWKLNLHILSRIVTWVDHILDQDVPVKIEVQQLDFETRNQLTIHLKLKFLTYLFYDIVQFNTKLKHPFTTGFSYLHVVPEQIRHLFFETLTEPQNQFKIILMSVEDLIVHILFTDCSVHLKHISQIPRLFRKTNRTSPNAPSTYLSIMTKPINMYNETYKSCVEIEVMRRILGKVHTRIIFEYKTLAENVLTSVTKTEQSLKKLNKKRSNLESSETSVVSDDQKIRQQVQLDLKYYSKVAKQYVDESILEELTTLLK